ncbi:MAG TPA: deoxyribose-phosphate aldolase [Roseiflexaceae bacterium]|nr:deoxyribose-phosphate aldolase [Roseiflexaceae bacterium]
MTTEIARLIDHTLLKPEATPEQIERLCAEAREHGFASVCVNPTYVARCAELLSGSSVAVCTVVGFPLGATTSAVKAFEAREAIEQGASEVDMVIAVGRLKAGEHDAVEEDIRLVVAAAHTGGAICKVIIETALLTDEEKTAVCRLAVRAGADFVKTSTGFAASGATLHDVALMRGVVGPEIGVKAAGGIRSLADALAMVKAGATRLGTSAGVQIALAAHGAALSDTSTSSY